MNAKYLGTAQVLGMVSILVSVFSWNNIEQSRLSRLRWHAGKQSVPRLSF